MEVNELKEIIREKTKSREDTKLFKYVLGECQLYNKNPDQVFEKLYKDNLSSFEKTGNIIFLKENEEIFNYLPSYASVEEICEKIKPLPLDNSGKSIGKVINYLKELGLNFRKSDVPVAINLILTNSLQKL
jgi:hypothetical protein